jgi:predicted RNase H-like HicB family nuclease
MMTIDDLLAQRWAVQGPKEHTDEHGNKHWEIRVAELPDFFVAGETIDEARDEYMPALRAFLEAVLGEGDAIQLPQNPSWQTASRVTTRSAAGLAFHAAMMETCTA